MRLSTSSSDPPLDGLRHADALEEAHRDIPDRPWSRIALAALVVTMALMAGWDMFWRERGYIAGDIKDDNAGWAAQRRRAEGDVVVLIGTSRNLFDVDLDVWQQTTGTRPIQLSLVGTSPRFILADLAHDTGFRGLVIADVFTPLFFGAFAGENAGVLSYWRHETPSQRIGHWLAIGPQEVFAYIHDQTKPEEQWRRLELPLRPGQAPAFVDPYKIGVSAPDRNSHVWNRILTDRFYREREIAIWHVLAHPRPGAQPINPTPVIAEVAANVAKIRARGGDVVFVMHPQTGFLEVGERHAFPRARFWDALLAGTHTQGIRYDDHPELEGFRLPELSHLDPRDAPLYTARLARLLQKLPAASSTETAPTVAHDRPDAGHPAPNEPAALPPSAGVH